MTWPSSHGRSSLPRESSRSFSAFRFRGRFQSKSSGRSLRNLFVAALLLTVVVVLLVAMLSLFIKPVTDCAPGSLASSARPSGLPTGKEPAYGPLSFLALPSGAYVLPHVACPQELTCCRTSRARRRLRATARRVPAGATRHRTSRARRPLPLARVAMSGGRLASCRLHCNTRHRSPDICSLHLYIPSQIPPVASLYTHRSHVYSRCVRFTKRIDERGSARLPAQIRPNQDCGKDDYRRSSPKATSGPASRAIQSQCSRAAPSTSDADASFFDGDCAPADAHGDREQRGKQQPHGRECDDIADGCSVGLARRLKMHEDLQLID